jgi:hypothetical protein
MRPLICQGTSAVGRVVDGIGAVDPDLRLRARMSSTSFMLSTLSMSFASSMLSASLRCLTPLVAAAAIIVQGCEDATGLAGGDTTVRVVHASPGAAPIDVLLNGRASAGNSNLAFGAATGCFGVDADDPQLTFRRTAGPTIPGPETFGFERRRRYIVVVSGAPSDLRFTSVSDIADPPELAAGRARVRLFNGTSVPGRIYVYFTPENEPQPQRVLVDSLLSRGYTPYLNVPAGAVTIQVNQGATESVLGVSQVGVAEGQELTVIAVDPTAGATGLRWLQTEACPPR